MLLYSARGRQLFNSFVFSLLRNVIFSDNIVKQETVQYVVENWNLFGHSFYDGRTCEEYEF